MTPPGIDPGTVRLVAQRLDHHASLETTKTLGFSENKQYKNENK